MDHGTTTLEDPPDGGAVVNIGAHDAVFGATIMVQECPSRREKMLFGHQSNGRLVRQVYERMLRLLSQIHNQREQDCLTVLDQPPQLGKGSNDAHKAAYRLE